MKSSNLYAEDYYNWLLGFIEDDIHDLSNYSVLMSVLFSREFYSLVPNDDNRVGDGLDLRNQFADELGEHLYFVDEDLPPYCTILEMMIALAIRIENDILYDPEKGYRVSEWFWIMLSNLDLENETDDCFDRERVVMTLNNFVDRKYGENGKFCLFPISKTATMAKKTATDMKNTEIWYQANYFFTEYLRQFD